MNLHARWLSAVLSFVVAITAICTWFVHRQTSTSAGAERYSSLRVGFAIEAPYAYLDEHGRVTGEAPEIFRRLSPRLGVKNIDWVRLDFASLMTELRLGRIDAIAAGMYVTPERSEQAAFTRPTATVRTALVLRKGETAVPKKPRLQDLSNRQPLRWATVHNAAENELLASAGVPAERIATVPNADRGIQAVAESSADVFVISSLTAGFQVSRNPQWPLEVRPLVDAPAGRPAFVFRLEDRALRDSMDEALASFLGTAEHRELVQPFGLTVDELSPTSP